MTKVDEYRAILQKIHKSTKSIFFVLFPPEYFDMEGSVILRTDVLKEKRCTLLKFVA